MLNKVSVDDINVKGQRVLVRCDFNVPLQDGKITENAYNTVKYEFNEGVVSVYLNDALIETTDSGYSIQDIISAGTDGTALGYIGKSLYSPDPAYKGTLKSFKLSATEIIPMKQKLQKQKKP